jgi:hypothetical protein
LVKKIATQFANELACRRSKQYEVSNELLSLYDECFDVFRSSSGSELERLFEAICKHVVVTTDCTGIDTSKSRKHYVEVVRRLIKLAEATTDPKDDEFNVFSSPYPNDDFIHTMITHNMPRDLLLSLMPEISAVLREVYFDEKSRWQHKAAVFKVMDIMEVYNSDFGLSLFTLIKDAVNCENKQISLAAVVSLTKLITHYHLAPDNEYKFILNALTTTMASVRAHLTFGALSDALFYLLKKDKVYLIDDQQFNDINTCILRAMKYGTENEFHEQSFYDSFSKISRLSAFGARLLPVLPQYRDAFNAFLKSPACKSTAGTPFETCLGTFVTFLYETNTPETKEEARDMIKKIISGEIQVKKFGTLMGNIGLCAFDLFDSDSEFQEKIIQSLLQIFPEGYRTCGQSIGNRYEATSEEEYSESDDEKIYPESGDSWNRRVQQYLNYSNVYFCIPDRTNKVEPMYINSDEIYTAVSNPLNGYSDVLGHCLQIAKKKERKFLPWAQETFEILAFLIRFARVTRFTRDFAWLYELILSETAIDPELQVYFSKIAFWTTADLLQSETTSSLIAKAIDVVVDNNALDYDIVNVTVNSRFEGLNMVSLIYKFVKCNPRVARKGILPHLSSLIDRRGELTLEVAQIVAFLGVTYGLRYLGVPRPENTKIISLSIIVQGFKYFSLKDLADACLPYISFDTTSEENTYLKKFAVLASAAELDSGLDHLHAFNVFHFDWIIFSSAMSHQNFNTGNETLNEIVQKSDKSLKFWLTLE